MEPERLKEIIAIAASASGFSLTKERVQKVEVPLSAVDDLMTRISPDEMEAAMFAMNYLEDIEDDLPLWGCVEEARYQAAIRSTSIFANYSHLGEILARHEATIQKRWLKKSKAQRLGILTSAWGRKVSIIGSSHLFLYASKW